jgi:hypothetical protein
MKPKKPIHKFNGGLGATLCNKCRKIITTGLTEDLHCSDCAGNSIHVYELIRENDGLVKIGQRANWVEWDENSAGKKLHEEPAVGRSLVLDLEGPVTFTWMTTSVTEIISQNSDEIKFKTKNSQYSLKIKNNEKN